jgi:hypothetical protein
MYKGARKEGGQREKKKERGRMKSSETEDGET